MITEQDLLLDDGRTLHVYDTGSDDTGPGSLPVFWHHGSPNTGTPPEPLFPSAAERGIRWVSFDRPGYAGSTPQPGRDVACVAGDVTSVADALGIRRFAVMGHSGGGPHALACAALLPDRVLATVAMSSPAPYAAAGLDWSAGMAAAQEEEIRATLEGRAALEQYLASHEFDPDVFTAADKAALAGDWAWLGQVAGLAMAGSPDGYLDDALAGVAPWGFAAEQAKPPVLLVHGDQDRMVPSAHSRWLAAHCRDAELWLRPGDGHVSVLGTSAVAALDWLTSHRG
jgi:pimeloyl-ACP methyl ester carboxylesterase